MGFSLDPASGGWPLDPPQWRSCESLRVNVAEEETALNGRKPASQDGKARTRTKPSVTLRRSATLLRVRSTPNAGSAFEAMTLFKLGPQDVLGCAQGKSKMGSKRELKRGHLSCPPESSSQSHCSSMIRTASTQ